MSIRQGSNIISYTKFITPDTIEAINNTSAAINANDKVWLNKVGDNYNIVDFNTLNRNNISTTGNPTISNNGIASGFTTSSYINLGTVPFNSASSWSFESEITTGNDVTSPQAMFVEAGASFFSSLFVENGVFRFNGTNNHSDWLFRIDSTTTLAANKTYKVKCAFTGTRYELYVNDILEASFDSSVKYFSANYTLGSNPGNFAFTGSINLLSTCLRLDGLTYWTPYSVNITQNSYTGIAQEFIDVNETGTVRTALTKEYETQSCYITLYNYTDRQQIAEHLPVLIEMYDSAGNKLGEKRVTSATANEITNYRFTLEHYFSYFTLTMLDSRYEFRQSGAHWTWDYLKSVSGSMANVQVVEV